MLKKTAIGGALLPAFLVLSPALPSSAQSLKTNTLRNISVIANKTDIASPEFSHTTLKITQGEIPNETNIEWEWQDGAIPDKGTLVLAANVKTNESQQEWQYLQKYKDGKLIENTLVDLSKGQTIALKKTSVKKEPNKIISKVRRDFLNTESDEIEITGIASYTPEES